MNTDETVEPAACCSHRQPIVKVVALHTSKKRSLARQAATSRHAQHGNVELTPDSPMRGWRLFLAQLHEVLAILLLTASTTSTALSFYERKVVLACLAIATLVVVLLNAALGYVQEARVEAAWAACFDQSLRYAPTQRGERHSPRRKLVLILPKRDRFQRTDAPFNRSARDDSGD